MSKRKPTISKGPATDFKVVLGQPLKVYRFIGLCLSGGKVNNSSLAEIEYYPEHEKIFLSRLEDRISSTREISADLLIHQMIAETEKLKMVAFDAPLRLPKCMRCRLKCPGYEACSETEIRWLWKEYGKIFAKRKPKKLFTPYTERCAEVYIANSLEEKFHPPHAMGANVAPLSARAQFISRRLKAPQIEVYPKLSLWRIGRSLKIQKTHLRSHKHAFDGWEARQSIVEKLVQKDVAFFYQQDQKNLIENPQSFDAFICALTAVLKHRKQVEKRPVGFPRSEAWIEIPKEQILWS